MYRRKSLEQQISANYILNFVEKVNILNKMFCCKPDLGCKSLKQLILTNQIKKFFRKFPDYPFNIVMFISPEPEKRHFTQVPWLRTSILPEAQLLHALLTTGLIKFPEGFLFPATDDVRFPKPVPSRTSCAQLGLGVVCLQSARGMTSPLGQCSVLSSAHHSIRIASGLQNSH